MIYEAPVSVVEVMNSDAVGASQGGSIGLPPEEF